MSSYFNVKNWRKNNKLRLVQGFGGKCACCGLEDDPIAYDFHHLDPNEKDFTITSKIMSWEKRVEEAKKCVLVCVICHRKVHAGMIAVPADAPRFDENRIQKKVEFDECPVCGGEKSIRRTTCSSKCDAQHRSRVDWEKVDLLAMYQESQSFSAVGRALGVNGNTVKKQMKKRGLV